MELCEMARNQKSQKVGHIHQSFIENLGGHEAAGGGSGGADTTLLHPSVVNQTGWENQYLHKRMED